jgi:hypothetical protein
MLKKYRKQKDSPYVSEYKKYQKEALKQNLIFRKSYFGQRLLNKEDN